MPLDASGRRPLKSRNLKVFQSLAAALARAGVSPNAISASSMVFASLAGLALAATLYQTGWAARACWLIAAVGLQFRLFANLLDGMVAVEGRRGGPTGDLWNEAPDRISDTAIFIGAGFATGGDPLLGFGAALVAIFVAYVRALGASLGAGQCFLGPQAKPQRMALMTAVCLFYTVSPQTWQTIGSETGNIQLTVLQMALAIVIVGGVLTASRRFRWIAAVLREKSGS